MPGWAPAQQTTKSAWHAGLAVPSRSFGVELLQRPAASPILNWRELKKRERIKRRRNHRKCCCCCCCRCSTCAASINQCALLTENYGVSVVGPAAQSATAGFAQPEDSHQKYRTNPHPARHAGNKQRNCFLRLFFFVCCFTATGSQQQCAIFIA